MDKNPLLSIVITSYTMDRIGDIYELLDSIKQQDYPNVEIVFVAERTRQLLESVETYVHEHSISGLKPVFNTDNPGQSPARNLGIDNASGSLVAFVDDDVVLYPDWASNIVAAFDDEEAIGVTGPAYPLWEKENLKWLPEEFYWIVSCTAFANLSEKQPVRTAWGMNMAFRKEAFEFCRFSDEFGHIAVEKKKAGPVVDDAEFSINLRLRSGKEIMFNPEAKVQHRVYEYRIQKGFVRGQSYWQGYSKAILKKNYSDDSDTREMRRERSLLTRIVFGLLPKTLASLFFRPRVSFRILRFSGYVLSLVALGYFAGNISWLGRITENRFR